jgi:hypothetical protein
MQDKLDTAEHYFKKFESIPIANAAASRLNPLPRAEEVAETLFEIGRDLLHRRQFDPAVQWLARSFDLLSEFEATGLDPDAERFLVCIGQALGK